MITLDDLYLEGEPASPPTSRPEPPRVSTAGNAALRQYLRWGLAMLSLGAAGIHFAVMGDHFNLTWYHGAFFAATAWLQLAWAVAIVVKPSRRLLVAGIIGNLVIAEIWLVSRTIGIPFGPESGVAEAVSFSDVLCTILEVGIVVGSVALLKPRFLDRPVPTAAALPGVAGVGVLVAALATLSLTPAFASGHSHGAAGHVHGATDGAAVAAGHTHTHGAGGASAQPAAAVPPHPFDPALPIDLSGVPGVSPQQQAQAENLLAATVRSLPQWSDPAYDTAHGFFSIGDGVTGVEHYVNLGFMGDDTILDPDKPESLVFDTRVSPKRLVAAMYMATPGTALTSVPDIGGPLTQWHIHNNLCFNAQGHVAGLTKADGSCAGNLQKGPLTPMIHVWIDKAHPCGQFAALEGIGGGQIAPGETVACDHVHSG
jgi:hypothetical protein